jgi:hypothetical protein
VPQHPKVAKLKTASCLPHRPKVSPSGFPPDFRQKRATLREPLAISKVMGFLLSLTAF